MSTSKLIWELATTNNIREVEAIVKEHKATNKWCFRYGMALGIVIGVCMALAFSNIFN